MRRYPILGGRKLSKARLRKKRETSSRAWATALQEHIEKHLGEGKLGAIAFARRSESE